MLLRCLYCLYCCCKQALFRGVLTLLLQSRKLSEGYLRYINFAVTVLTAFEVYFIITVERDLEVYLYCPDDIEDF